MRLSHLIRGEGFQFRVEADLKNLPGGLGDWNLDLCARAYRDPETRQLGIACFADEMDYVVAAAHEISEVRQEFSGHHAELFCEQAVLLGRWLLLVHEQALRHQRCGQAEHGEDVVCDRMGFDTDGRGWVHPQWRKGRLAVKHCRQCERPVREPGTPVSEAHPEIGEAYGEHLRPFCYDCHPSERKRQAAGGKQKARKPEGRRKKK